jgi:adenylate kinase family enzyme
MWLSSIKTGLKKGFLNKDRHFLQRWPTHPKVVFYGPPNVFQDEITQRFAVDVGVPVVSMNTVLRNVAEQAGKTEEFSHSFFIRVRDMLNAGDEEGLIKEKVHTKLLRLCSQAQNGFVLTDFPANVAQAETLESFRGGLNAFVHVSLPEDILVDIEENKHECADCGREYFPETIVDEGLGIRIAPFMPEIDGHCVDCGSTNIRSSSDPISFERELEAYKASKEDLLAFYNHFGTLVDFELKQGFEDYDNLKRKIQMNIKH